MGRIFYDHWGGRCCYMCEKCGVYLSNKKEIISTNFTGVTGQAYLFKNVANVRLGTRSVREMITGAHTVRDVFCLRCSTKIGWMYEFVSKPNERYKEGAIALERKLFTESEDFQDEPLQIGSSNTERDDDEKSTSRMGEDEAEEGTSVRADSATTSRPATTVRSFLGRSRFEGSFPSSRTNPSSDTSRTDTSSTMRLFHPLIGTSLNGIHEFERFPVDHLNSHDAAMAREENRQAYDAALRQLQSRTSIGDSDMASMMAIVNTRSLSFRRPTPSARDSIRRRLESAALQSTRERTRSQTFGQRIHASQDSSVVQPEQAEEWSYAEARAHILNEMLPSRNAANAANQSSSDDDEGFPFGRDPVRPELFDTSDLEEFLRNRRRQ